MHYTTAVVHVPLKRLPLNYVIAFTAKTEVHRFTLILLISFVFSLR